MATKKTTTKTAAKTTVKAATAKKPAAALKTATAKKPAAVLKTETVKKPAPVVKKSNTAAAKKPAPAASAPVLPGLIKPVEAAAAASQETMEAVVKAGTQAATKSYEQAVAMAQEQVEKASSGVFNGYDEVASLGQETVDAYVQSTTVFAKAVEVMGKELMNFAQNAAEANVANAQALFAAKTVQELIDLQTEISRSRYDSLMTESAKLTELSITLANDAAEPIQARLNATVEKLMKPLAA